MSLPGATTSGLSSSSLLLSPSSSLGPELEYEAIESSPLPMVSLSSIDPIVIAWSAAPTDVTLLLPSFPIAATGTMPASAAWFTARASAAVPLSPGSSPLGSPRLPKDIDMTWIPSLESLLPQSVSTLAVTQFIPFSVAAELVPPVSVITLTSTRYAPGA